MINQPQKFSAFTKIHYLTLFDLKTSFILGHPHYILSTQILINDFSAKYIYHKNFWLAIRYLLLFQFPNAWVNSSVMGYKF